MGRYYCGEEQRLLPTCNYWGARLDSDTNFKSKYMRNIQGIFVTTLLTVTLAYSALGQGCSDAGFCTINSLQPNHSDTTAATKNQCMLGLSVGGADHDIVIWSNLLEYRRQINDRLGMGLKVTTLAQSGNNIMAFGASDVFLDAHYRLGKKVKLTLGAKIPLTNGNSTQDNLALPMDYQSSLGTFDLIVGFGYSIQRLQLIAAIQQPITQNKNRFLAEEYPTDPIRGFQSTNKFTRSGDVLLRISYPVSLGQKWKITPSILPIYHLKNDQFTDFIGKNVAIQGSQGLTLNANAYVDYEINRQNALQLSFGMPLLVRDARPDGLTRSFLVSVEYGIKF
ncbi:MAG: hypothetical protein RIQ78_1012 [Bacteroidota bacterium]|jgi:hypothetical protein